jgi:hypothetical protein
MTSPSRIFRYFSPEASDLFSSEKLWVSAATDFNDVFEMAPRYDTFVEAEYVKGLEKEFAFLSPEVRVTWSEYKQGMQPLIQQSIADDLEILPESFQKRFSQHFGIVCFASKHECLLMWGHYARSHSGFVVEFAPEHPLFSPSEFEKVVYSENRPSIDILDYRKIILQKSPEWSYEQEFRLVKPLPTLSKALRRDGKEKYFLPLPLDAVKAVYIGMRMPEQNRDELLKSVNSTGREHIAKYGVRRHRDKYAITMVPWDKIKAPPANAQGIMNDLWKAIGL